MFYHPRDNDEQNPGQQTANRGDSYFVFNPSSGLYEPQSYAEQRNSQHDSTRAFWKSALDVRVRRDWIALGIGVLTLVLLGFTVRYAHQQWEEMVIAANGTTRSARAAWVSAQTAADALEDNRESLRSTLGQMKIQSWSQFQSADAAVRASRAAARQVGAMQDLATQAARSATAAEISVSRTDRPWVGVIGEVIVTPQSQEIAEFMHNPKLRLPLKYRQAIIGMKNYGPVPALHVNAVIEPVPVTDNADKDNLAIDRAYDYVCLSAGMDTRQMMDVGFYFIGPKEHREKVPFTSPARGAIVFPNEPVQESPSLEPWFEAEYAWPDLTGKKPFCLVGCIGYADKTARNQERDDVNRHVFFTRFCYVSQTPMDSITTPTPIGTKCGYNETAE